MEEQSLDSMIAEYYEHKSILDEQKKLVDVLNGHIKKIMEENDFDDYITEDGNYVAKKIIQNRESFKEPNLIAKLKELGVTSPLKTIEVIDYDELENVIYNGVLDAGLLSEFRENKEVVTLKVSKKKGSK